MRSCEEVKRKEAQRGIVNAYEEMQMRGGGGKKKKNDGVIGEERICL